MSRIEALKGVGVNYHYGLKLLNNREDLYEHYLLNFDKARQGEAMILSMRDKDYERSFSYAIGLSGEARNLGMKELGKNLYQFGCALRRGNEEEIAKHYGPTKSLYIKTRALLDCMRHGYLA